MENENNKDFIHGLDEALQDLPVESDIFMSHALDIAKAIKNARCDMGIIQKQLAQSFDKSEAEISKWLSGTHNFTLRTIAKIESVLGIEIINPRIAFYASNRQSEVSVPSITTNTSVAVNIFVQSDFSDMMPTIEGKLGYQFIQSTELINQ